MLWASFCWKNFGPGIHLDVTLTCTPYLPLLMAKYTPSWQQNSLMVVDFFSKIIPHFHTAKSFQEFIEKHIKAFEVLTWPPRSQSDYASVNYAGQTNLIHKGLHHLLLSSSCQRPQHTFWGHAGSITWWDRSVFGSIRHKVDTILGCGCKEILTKSI